MIVAVEHVVLHDEKAHSEGRLLEIVSCGSGNRQTKTTHSFGVLCILSRRNQLASWTTLHNTHTTLRRLIFDTSVDARCDGQRTKLCLS